jgi:hypothetical protein
MTEPGFCERAFARPDNPSDEPAVNTARRILAECEATEPSHDNDEIWERYGALQAAVEGMLRLVDRQETPR